VEVYITKLYKGKNMSSHKNHSHLEKIKEAVINSTQLSEDEKANSIKHIEEWILEDKADGILVDELSKISSKIKPLLAELGLL
jgi:hypothetical protein